MVTFCKKYMAFSWKVKKREIYNRIFEYINIVCYYFYVYTIIFLNMKKYLQYFFALHGNMTWKQFFVNTLILTIIWVWTSLLYSEFELDIVSFIALSGYYELLTFVFNIWHLVALVIYVTWYIATYTKRIETVGLSKWTLLLFLIPIVNLVYFIYLIFAKPKVKVEEEKKNDNI
jgi:uncharacterized membrane protein YhaH (DUF805 family)